jgi:hypothetical protein
VGGEAVRRARIYATVLVIGISRENGVTGDGAMSDGRSRWTASIYPEDSATPSRESRANVPRDCVRPSSRDG